jgi:hypothetical protein
MNVNLIGKAKTHMSSSEDAIMNLLDLSSLALAFFLGQLRRRFSEEGLLPPSGSPSDMVREACGNRPCNLSNVSPWPLNAPLVAHYLRCPEPSVTVTGSVHL